jgi:hypothetical protein
MPSCRLGHDHLPHRRAISRFFYVACLLAFATSWRRHATMAAPCSSLVAFIQIGLSTSAVAMILPLGVKGALPIRKPGGS